MKKTLALLMISLALTVFLKAPSTAQTAANNDGEKTLVENIKSERDSARHKACIANMKTISGACELYAMEQPSLDKVTLKALVDEKYLKTIPKCMDAEDKDYQIIIATQKDGSPVDVVCSYHSSLNNPAPQEKKDDGGQTSIEQLKNQSSDAKAKACIATLKTISGACDLYAMENSSLKNVTLKALVDGKYLKKMPQCPEVGEQAYQIVVAPQPGGEPFDIKCVKHGSLNSAPISPEDQNRLNKELIKSVQSNDAFHAEIFITGKADKNFKTSSGTTALHYAAFNGNVEIINLLIKNGADVKAKAKDGVTPLHYAASKNSKDAVKILIEKGADINAKDAKGKTPLNYAKNNEIINFLKSMGVK